MKSAALALTLTLLFAASTGMLFVHAAADSWVSKASMHVARAFLGVAVVNGKIYAIGGATGSGVCAFNEEYDPATDTWTLKAPMPTPRTQFGIAVYQNRIYCIGGSTTGISATGVNEVYDPTTDTWETKAPMPTVRMALQANVVNGKIYLIGGHSVAYELNFSGLNEVYDPVTNTWTTKAAMPTNTMTIPRASAVVGNKIYLLSAAPINHGTTYLNQVYDVKNDSWSIGAPPISAANASSGGATTGVNAPLRIYMFVTGPEGKSQSYDPATDSWTDCAPMPTGRFGTSVGVVGDRFYVIGGWTYGEVLFISPSTVHSAVNEQYTPIGYGKPDPFYLLPIKIAITSPSDQTYNATSVSLVFNVNKPTSWMGYSLDGQENVAIAGNTTIVGLKSGLHNITVYAEDNFGNIGTSETSCFAVAKGIEQETFPSNLIAAVAVAAAIVGLGLIVYLRKHRRSLNHRNKRQLWTE